MIVQSRWIFRRARPERRSDHHCTAPHRTAIVRKDTDDDDDDDDDDTTEMNDPWKSRRRRSMILVTRVSSLLCSVPFPSPYSTR